MRAASFAAAEFWSHAGIWSFTGACGACDAVAIVAIANGGAPPEVLASDVPLQLCEGRADKVALMFIKVVSKWAAKIAMSNFEVPIGHTLDLTAVRKLTFKVFYGSPLACESLEAVRVLTGHNGS